MNTLSQLYRHSLALLTDLYQLTMAYGYWKSKMDDVEAAFHLFFRRNPFDGGYAVTCGLEYAIEWLRQFRFDDGDLTYLASLRGADGRPLFEEAFFDDLARLTFTCDVDALPEGTVTFAHEPLVRVTGPILQAQLLETPLLNLINFQTLIATKAARVCLAASGQTVIEFGLRRAQGIDGGLAASRAAYVGGCHATSNVLAGRLFDIPVRGTHAHSWVMAYGDELAAFQAYAEAMPNNCIFLVDTYDSLQGVRNAIEVGRRLRRQGHEMIGIRLDSGDLAWLSIQARKLLDEAGFSEAVIVASSDLDERIIESLNTQHARIDVWGVGTRLVTAYDQPALGGVYKLAAVRRRGQPWQHRIKLSEQLVKITDPGILQVRRFRHTDECVGDMIYCQQLGAEGPAVLIDPEDESRRKQIPHDALHEDLLVPVFREGACVYQSPPLVDVRRRTAEQLAGMSDSIKRLVNPHEYPVGLHPGLHALKKRLIHEARGIVGE